MKKYLVGLTAASVLAAFAIVPATPVAADPPYFKSDRDHYKYRHYGKRHRDDGVTLRFGSPSRCYYYWRYGVRYRHCEPSGGLSFRFKF